MKLSTLSALSEELEKHPLFSRIESLEDLRFFMRHHVYAVWDFMSLLKSLQQKLSCVQVPWVPQGDPNLRRLINEIVLGEETDEDGKGGFSSHFELYQDAMEQCGADATVVDAVIEGIKAGLTPATALRKAGASVGAQKFCATTFDVIEAGSVAEVATAFALSRDSGQKQLQLLRHCQLRSHQTSLHRTFEHQPMRLPSAVQSQV